MGRHGDRDMRDRQTGEERTQAQRDNERKEGAKKQRNRDPRGLSGTGGGGMGWDRESPHLSQICSWSLTPAAATAASAAASTASLAWALEEVTAWGDGRGRGQGTGGAALGQRPGRGCSGARGSESLRVTWKSSHGAKPGSQSLPLTRPSHPAKAQQSLREPRSPPSG